MRSQCLPEPVAVPVHTDWKMNTGIWGFSVADPGCLPGPPDPNFSIPDLGSKKSESASKNLSIFYPKKLFPSSRKYDPGCSSRIRILTFYPKKEPDLRSGSATVIWPVFAHAARGPAHLHGLIGGTGGHPLPVEVVRHIVDQILVVCLQRGAPALQEIAIIKSNQIKGENFFFLLSSSVGDLDPDPEDPHVIRPTGSGSISQRYGSGPGPGLDSDFLINMLSELSVV